MPFDCTCPHCGALHRSLPDDWRGRKGTCSRCRQIFQLMAGQDERDGTGREDRVHWEPGDVISGLYSVESELGRGGFGVVHGVRHLAWNLLLAVKSPTPEALVRAGGAEAFRKEAETWLDLGLHPHVATCYLVTTLSGVPRVFTELVAGGSLADWIAKGVVNSCSTLLDIAIQFAWGLEHAHGKGLVHQDVKPHNVLMTPDGTAKVTDFGLARSRFPVGEKGDPGAGLVTVGGCTPPYASPEQAMGGKVSSATDVWSFAVSMLHMFTGALTWGSGTIALAVLEDYLDQGQGGPVPMPQSVASLLRECFRDDPAGRPSMSQVADRLGAMYRDACGERHPRNRPDGGAATAKNLNNRALSLLDLGQADQAEQAWSQALEVRPGHPESTYNQALYRWRQGRLDPLHVERELEEVARSLPEDPDVAFLRGLVLMERGRYAEAVSMLQPLDGTPIPGLSEARQEAVRLLVRSRKLERSLGPDFGRAVVTPDGGLVLAASAQAPWRAWTMDPGTQVPKGELDLPSRAEHLRMSENGDLALAVDAKGMATLIDVPSCSAVSTWHAAVSRISAVDFHAGGDLAVIAETGGLEGEPLISLWETGVGRRCHVYTREYATQFDHLALSPDAATLVASSGSILLAWDVERGTQLFTTSLPTGMSSLHGLGFSRDGTRIVAVSQTMALAAFQVVDGVQTGLPDTFSCSSPTVSFTADGGHAVYVDRSRLHFWEREPGRIRDTEELSGGIGTCVSLTPEGSFAMAACNDGTLHVIVPHLGHDGYRAPFIVSRHDSSERTAEEQDLFQEDLRKGLAALEQGDMDGALDHLARARQSELFGRTPEAIDAWALLYSVYARTSLRDGWLRGAIDNRGVPVSALAISPTGRNVFVAHYHHESNRDIIVRSLDGSHRVIPLADHPDDITAMEVHSSGTMLTTAGGLRDSTIRTIDVESGRELRRIRMEYPCADVCLGMDTVFTFAAVGKRIVCLLGNSGTEFLRYEGHYSRVNSLCLSRDETLLASAAEDGQVIVWDVASGQARARLDTSVEMAAVALSADRRLVFAGGRDGIIRVWDHVQDAVLAEIPGYTSQWRGGLVPSPDSRFVVAAMGDRLAAWRSDDGSLECEFRPHPSAINGLAVSADLSMVASVAGREDITLSMLDWELAGSGERSFDATGLAILRAELRLRAPRMAEPQPWGSPGLRRLALTRAGMPVLEQGFLERIMRRLGQAGYGMIPRDEVLRRIREMDAVRPDTDGEDALEDAPATMEAMPETRVLASLYQRPEQTPQQPWDSAPDKGADIGADKVEDDAEDEVIPILPVQLGTEDLRRVEEHLANHRGREAARIVRPMRWLYPHSESLAELWQRISVQVPKAAIDRMDEIWTRHYGDEPVNALAMVPECHSFAMGGPRGGIMLCGTGTGDMIHELEGHTAPVTSLAFNLNGKRLVSGGMDLVARVWSTSTGELLHALAGLPDVVADARLDPEGETALVMTAGLLSPVSGQLTWRTVQSNRLVKDFGPFDSTLTAMWHGRYFDCVACGDMGGRVRLLWGEQHPQDLSPRIDEKAHEGRVSGVSLDTGSPRFMLSAGEDGVILFWDVQNGGHDVLDRAGVPATCAVLSADARFAVAGFENGEVRVYDTRRGERVFEHGGESVRVHSLAWGLAGFHLAAGYGDGRVRMWRLEYDLEIDDH